MRKGTITLDRKHIKVRKSLGTQVKHQDLDAHIIKFKNDLMDFVSDDVKLISAPLGEITILGTKFGVLLEANLALNCDVVSYETIKVLGKCGWYTK